MKNIRLISFAIECDEISPCGGFVNIKPIGHYQIMSDIDNNVIDEYTKEVNAIIRIDKNDWFKLSNKTILFEANRTNETKSVNISATYLFKGKKIIATKELIQYPNKEEDFILTETTINSIHIISNKETLSKNGDNATIKVVGNFTYRYEQYDSCGNKIDDKIEIINNKDITDECELTLANSNEWVELNNNTVICHKQDIESKERKCKIFAKYGDRADHVVLTQEKGSEISYSYDLFFDGGNSEAEIELIDNVGIISFVSNENMVCEGKLIDSIISQDFKVKSSDDWYGTKVSHLGKAFSLTIETKSRNESSTDDRVGYVYIISPNGMEMIKCKVIQPHKRLVDCLYGVNVIGDRDFTIDNINKAQIAFKSFKTAYYDDGSTEVSDITHNDRLNLDFISERPSILKLSELIMTDFKGSGYAELIFNDKIPFFEDEIKLHARTFISNKNTNEIYESSISEFDILLKNDIKSRYSDCDVKVRLNKGNDDEIIIKDMTLVIETKYGVEVLEKTIPYVWLPSMAKSDVILFETIELLDGMEYRIYDIDGKIKDCSFVYSKDSDEIIVDAYFIL